MRADWIPCTHPPKEPGSYLVTTCRGKVRLDRFDGDKWGMCNPKKQGKGRYRPHLAWTFSPKPYQPTKEDDNGGNGND